MKSKKSFRMVLTAMAAGTALLAVTAAGMGRYHIDPVTVVKILLSKAVSLPVSWDAQAESVVWTLRLPRILTALMVGGALSLSCVCRGLFGYIIRRKFYNCSSGCLCRGDSGSRDCYTDSEGSEEFFYDDAGAGRRYYQWVYEFYSGTFEVSCRSGDTAGIHHPLAAGKSG